MKNKILLIASIFMIILIISLYGIYKYRSSIYESQKINNEYKSYYNSQVIGAELVSIMNRTEDVNEKYGVKKNEEGFFIENETNSIRIYISFKYEDEYRTLEMERIINNGTQNFLKVYSTANFKCTDISYHSSSNNVKSLTFTET